MTCAQIELMTYDIILTVFNKPKKDKFGKVSKSKLEEAAEEWKNKYGSEKVGAIKLTDLLSGKQLKSK